MDVWIQILLIAFGMSIFSKVLNKILHLDSKNMRAMQQRLRELSRQLNYVRNGGIGTTPDGQPVRFEEIQQEAMALAKRMMKEQLLPMGIHCGIFFGIFALLSFLYGQYASGVLPFEVPLFGSGWLGAYVMFSFIIGISLFSLRKLLEKMRGPPPTSASQTPSPQAPSLTRQTQPAWKQKAMVAKEQSASNEQGQDVTSSRDPNQDQGSV